MAINQIAKLGVKVDPKGAITGANRAKKAIQGIGKVAGSIKKQIFSLQGALVGLGSGLAIKSAITYGSEIENLRIRLKFLTGDTDKASDAFDQMLDLSKRAPVSLQEIQRASPLLLTVADDVKQLTSLLEMTGDIAEVSGLSFEKTAEQIQRAFSSGIASAEMFREKAVTQMMGFEAGVSVTGEKTKKIFVDMFADGTAVMKGAMVAGADTMKGQISMMKDGWDALLLAFSEAGAFEATKRAIKEITESLKSPEALTMAEQMGEAVGKFIDATIGMKGALFDMVANVEVALMRFGRLPETIVGSELAIKKLEGRIEELKRSMDDSGAWWEPLKDLTYDNATKKIIMGMYKDLYELEQLRDRLIEEKGGLTIPIKLEGEEKIVETLQGRYKDLNTSMSASIRAMDLIGQHQDKNSISAIVLGESYIKLKDQIEEAKEKQQEFADGLANTIENSIMRMTQGLMSFKDVVKSIFRQVASEMIRYNIAKPLASSLSQIVANTFGGAITGTSGINVPPRANGGNVNAGQPYMVGERGAELFVPKSSGDIVPNNQIGGNTVINVTYSPQVNALDPRTAGQVIFENAPTIVGVVRQAFERNGQQVLL